MPVIETIGRTENGYFALWNRAQVRPSRGLTASAIAKRIFENRLTYLQIEQVTSVPWQWIGAIFYREADLNFKCAFANGDEIIGTDRKTYNVPAGRGPFETFHDSAVDEIHRRGLHTIGLKQWTVEMMLFQAEALNGWGYLGKCNSPYVWSFTTMYGPPESAGGKYDPDHHWNPLDIDKQCGVVAILDELALIDKDTAKLLENRSLAPPAFIISKEVAKTNSGKRKVIAGGVGAAGVGTAGTLTKVSDGAIPWYETTPMLVLMGFGLMIVVVAVTLSIQTGNLIKARW